MPNITLLHITLELCRVHGLSTQRDC